MGIKERKIREKEVLRRKILDSARDLLLREGYERFTMRKLADQIEYTPTTIYLYFKDKDELVGEVCEESFRGLLRVLEKIGRKNDDPVEAVRAGCRAYVDFGLAYPSHYRVTFMTSREREYTPEEFVQLNEKYPAGMEAYGFLRTAVDTCIKQGKFKNVELDVATQVIWAGIHGITSLLIVKLRDMQNVDLGAFHSVKPDRLIDQVIDTMIRGLLA